MNIPNNLVDFIKSEAKRVHHGRIILEINETSDKVDVITESRERFQQKQKKEANPKEFRKG